VTVQDLAALQTDVLAGFVLARAAARSRRQQRPRPLLGPAATPPTLQFH
jgi:hypothetical protein